MFFPLQILKERGSNLAIVWRAATLKLKSKDKADLLKVDLEEICREIMRQGIPALGNGASKDGFSLRLSAQLLHGVTIILTAQIKNLSAFARSVEKSLEFTVIYESLLTKDVDMQSLSSFSSVAFEHGLESDSSHERRKKKRLDKLQLLEEPYILPIPEMCETGRFAANINDITLPPDLPSQSLQHEMFMEEMDHQTLPVPTEEQFDLASLMQEVDHHDKLPETFLNGNLQTPEAAIRPDPTSPPKPSQQHEESVLAEPLPEDQEPMPPPPQLEETYNILPAADQVSSDISSKLELGEIEIQRIRKTKKLIVDSKTKLDSDNFRTRMNLPKKKIADYIEEGHLNDPSSLQSVDGVFNHPTIGKKRKYDTIIEQMVADEVDFLQKNPNWEREVDMSDIGALAEETDTSLKQFGDSDVTEKLRDDSASISQARAGTSGIGGLSILSELNKTERSKMGLSGDAIPEISAIEPEPMVEEMMDIEQPDITYTERTFTKSDFMSKVEEFSTDHGYALFSDITQGMNKKDTARVFMLMLKEASLGSIVTRQEAPFESIKIEMIV